MRNLEASELFKAVRLLKVSGLRDKIKPVLETAARDGVSIESIGVDAIMTCVAALAENSTEKGLYELLAGPFEKTPEEMAHLDLLDLCDGIEWLWKDGNLRPFFERLSRLIGSK